MRRRPAAWVAVLTAVLFLAGCADSPPPDSAAESGYVSGDGSIETWAAAERRQPVELSGVSFADEPIDLADWRGDVVVVNFWYANCPPCRKEAPDLAALSEQYAEQGVRFLGVNHVDSPGNAQAFERRFGIPYPSLQDSQGEGVAAMQGVVPLRAMPTTVVLDREGRVAARILGLAERSLLAALIDETLDE